MKKVSTLLLLAAFMLSALFIQAQLPEKKSMEEFRKPGARSLIETRKKRQMKAEAKTDQKTTRKMITGDQMTPSAIIFQEYDEIEEKWVNALKFSITYENVIYEKEIIIEVFFNDELFLNEKQVYFYNEVWELQEIETYEYTGDTKKWELVNKQLSHTDLYGNIILEALLYFDAYYQTWDTAYGTKYNYVYNSSGEPLEIVVLTFDIWMLEWMPWYKELYIYDNANLLSEFIYFYWDDYEEEFLQDYREVYSYDEMNQWSEVLIYSWFFDEWYPDFKLSDFEWFDFSQEKFLSLVAYIYTYGPDPWELFFRSTAAYHPELEERTYLLEEYYDEWNQGWVPDYREILEFDENHLPVLSTIEYYQDGMWWIDMGIRNTYELNAQGFVEWNISEWYDVFFANDWVYWMKLIFEYDNTTGVPVHTQPLVSVKAYPNPFADVLNLIIEQACKILVLDVFNSQGQLIMNQAYRNYEPYAPIAIDLGRQQPGMYFIQVQADGKSQMLKVVKR